MDLVDLNFETVLLLLCFKSRDPYGSRGSKSKITRIKNLFATVEILMDLVDLNDIA